MNVNINNSTQFPTIETFCVNEAHLGLMVKAKNNEKIYFPSKRIFVQR